MISYDIVDSAAPTIVLDSSELNITVIPGPVEIAISASKDSAVEQSSSDDTLEFTLTQNVASDQDSSVKVTLDGSSPDITASDIARLQYTKADGTEVNTADQSVIANFLTNGDDVLIAAGSKTSTVTFTIADDSAYEQTENLGLVISNPVNPNGISITTDTDSGVILDEDATNGTPQEGDKPTVRIEATDSEAIEGIDNALSYTVKQDNLSNLATTVQVTIDVNNSDVEAADIASITYINAAGIPVTITGSTAIQAVLDGSTVLDVKVPVGGTAAPVITVTTNTDDIYENSEQLSFVITNADNAEIDNTVATGTIVDESDATDPGDGSNTDGDKPTAIVTGDSVTEGNALEFTVDLSNLSESDTTVSLTLENGSALLGTDTGTPVEVSVDGGNTFSTVTVAVDGTFGVDVPANSTNGIIVRVPTVDDNIDEPNETITLTASTSGQVTPSTATGTIIDNDDAPVISIVGATLVNEDAGTVTYTVSLTNPSSTAVTVDYATSNGTATAGADYGANSGTLTFAAGEVTKTVTVAITDDTLFENSENYTIALSNPSLNASIDSTQASVTTAIIDNDTAPTIAIENTDAATTPADNSVVEGTSNTITGAITITNPQSVAALTINNTDVTTATTANPVIINGSEGKLVITGYNATTGALTYEYTENGSAETHNTAGDNVLDQFTVTLTNSAGGTSSDTLDIQIIDTAPVANADTNIMTEETDKVTGNVLTATGAAATDVADSLGADATTVNAVESVTSATVAGTVGGSTQGDYGVLSLNADGSYSYDLDNVATQYLALGESLIETFNYTIRDADGDTSTTTLTVTINGTNDRPVITNVANGNNIIETAAAITEQTTDPANITRTGTISFTDTDGSDEPTISELPAENIYVYDPNNSTFTNTNQLTGVQKIALSSIFEAKNDTGSFTDGTWNINASSTVLDFIPAGETITIRYAVQVDDDKGVITAADGNELSTSEIRYVEVTITGTDDSIALVADTASTNEDTILSVTAANGIFENDTADVDVNTELTVESYTINGMTDTNGIPEPFNVGDVTNVTIDDVIIGKLTINADGSYTFEPAENFSGTVPEITITVNNGPDAATPESGTETLTITVDPVSDAPDIGNNIALSTDEDTTTASLGLKAPVITDATDRDGTGNADDSPERIGLITLTGIPNGAKLNYDGVNPDKEDGSPITIFLTNSDIFLNGITEADADYQMTVEQFELMTLTPPEDDATNISFNMSVTEYEVDNSGNVLAGVAGAESTVTIDIDVQAVTDSSNNNQIGDGFSTFGYDDAVAGVTGNVYTVSAREGESVDLPITTTFGDLVNGGRNRETYGFVISGLQPDAVISFTPAGSSTAIDYTVDSNGQVLLGVDSATPTSTTLAVNGGSEPKISIKSADYNSQDMDNITVSLYTQDHDRNSDLDPNLPGNQRDATVELISTVTVDMTVTPVPGQVKLDNTGVQTEEDTAVTLDKFGFTVLDTQNGAGAETITEISFVLPEGWSYVDGVDSANNVTNAAAVTTITIDMTSSPDLSTFSIKPPAQSSTDTDFTFTVTTEDTDDDGSNTVSSTTTLGQTVTITPVAEVVGSNIDGDGTIDLTINPDHVYTTAAQEDAAFNLGADGAFNLIDNWSNQDDSIDFGTESHTTAANDSEQTYAHLTFGNKDGSTFTAVEGAVFTYTDGNGNPVNLTDSGNGVDIPAAYLNSVTVTPPADYSEFNVVSPATTAVKVQAKTIDYDEDGGASVTATSGESYLTFTVKGVADPITVGLDSAYGDEDQAIVGNNERDGTVMPAVVTPTDGIPLNIRPSSRDNDGSEKYEVKISDIPSGARLYQDNGGVVTLLDTSSGSVTISDYTNTVDNLYFVAAENFSGTIPLIVQAKGIESDGNETVFTPNPGLTLPVKIAGKADLILNDNLNSVPQTIDGTEYSYTKIVTEDANNDSIAVSSFFANAGSIAPYDDGSSDLILNNAEAISYSITGVPEGFNITGAGVVFLGGNGEARTWSVSLSAITNNTAQLTTPEHFAGDISFDITGATTERVSGDSVTQTTKTVSILVIPDAADGTVNNPQVLATEDEWTTIDFKDAFSSDDKTSVADNMTGYESLKDITLSVADLTGKNIVLRVDNVEVDLTTNPPPTLKFTAEQTIEFKYDAAKEHSDTPVDIPFDYTYTDTATLDNSVPPISASNTGSAVVNVTFQAVTDAPTIALDIANADVSIDNGGFNDTAMVTVSVSSPDTDNSEIFTRLEVTGVPSGIIVRGGILSSGVWYVNVPDQAITTGPNPTYALMLEIDNTNNIEAKNFDVTVTVITQDIAGQGLDGTEERDSQNFTLELTTIEPGNTPIPPNLVDELVVNSVTPDEDSTFNLGDVLDATLNSVTASSVSAYSFELSGIPAGTDLTVDPNFASQVIVTKIGDQYIISVDEASLLTPEQALAAISIELPADFSTNATGQEFIFNAIFTARDNEGREDASLTKNVAITVKPVTDAFDNNGQTSVVSTDEDIAVDIVIDLTNSADGDYVSLVDGKLYIKIDETELKTGSGTAGELKYNGITVTPDIDGNYIVDLNNGTGDLVNPPDSVTVQYTPAANADGDVTVTVKASHKEVSDVADNGAVVDYEYQYNVEVAAQPDALNIFEPVTEETTTTVIGAEDTKIAIPYEIGLIDTQGDSDGSGGTDTVKDSAAAISLDNVPNGYLVYYIDINGVEVLASNNGNLNGNGNLWTIDATDLNSNPNSILIQPPENVSGTVAGIEVKVVSDSGVVSAPLKVTLDVTPVADDITFNPSTVLGSQGEWTALNLNAAMVDVDGSETVNVILTGTNLYGNVLSVKTNSGTPLEDVTFVFDEVTGTGTYTIKGVTPDQLNELLVKGGAPYDGTLKISLETVESANGDSLTIDEVDLPVDIAPTLIFGGTTGDDKLISVNQTSALKYSGGDGNDTFIGGSGKDTLNGDAGNDTLIGGAGNDTINGGADDDTIDGGAGADTIDGGTGNDTIVFDAADLVINGGDGIDTLLITDTSIDFGSFNSSVLDNFEVFDMTDGSAQSLTNLSTSDVIDVTDSSNKLFVNGDNTDTVSLTSEFAKQQTSDQTGYDLYQSTTDSSVALYIDTDIDTTVII